MLKEENIHIALDTAGVGNGNYEEILSYVDLIILDIKHTNKEGYKPVWIRQVIVPGTTDTFEYLQELKEYLKGIKNIEKIEFLPYHILGKEKYKNLGLNYPYEHLDSMDSQKCTKLYNDFIKDFNHKTNKK